MKTDDLIAALAADTLPQQSVGQRSWRVLPVAIGLSALAFVVFWGPRSDIREAMASAVALKTVLPLVLVVQSGLLAFALAHPGMHARARQAALGALASGLAGAFAIVLAREGFAGLTTALVTPSLMVCLLSIPALAIPILGGMLWVLSTGAALRPRQAGAAAGLVAGGVAASIYSLYCDQDAALFVIPAYSAAILILALAGALVGPRLLKW